MTLSARHASDSTVQIIVLVTCCLIASGPSWATPPELGECPVESADLDECTDSPPTGPEHAPQLELGQVSGDPPYKIYDLHVDHLGSTRLVTDDQGSVVSRHDFFPFGEEIMPMADDTTKMFTGHERDRETGLDYMLARYYSKSLGRFTRPDPKPASARALLVQSWNRYPYALNNPIRYLDPDGRDIYDTTGNPVVGQEGGDLTATPIVQELFGPGAPRDLTLMTDSVDGAVGETRVLESGNMELVVDLDKMGKKAWQERYGASSALNLLIKTLGHELGHAVLEALGLGKSVEEGGETDADEAAVVMRQQRVETFAPEPDDDVDGQGGEEQTPDEDGGTDTPGEPSSYGIDPDGPYGPMPRPCQGKGPLC